MAVGVKDSTLIGFSWRETPYCIDGALSAFLTKPVNYSTSFSAPM